MICIIIFSIFIIIKISQTFYINNYDNTIIGQVIKLEQKEYYQKITIKYKVFKIIIKDYNNYHLRLGDIIKITGVKQEIESNHIPYAFNYKQYFYNNLYLYEIKSDNIIILNHKISIYVFNEIINNYLINNFDNETLIILKGFILGDTSDFNESLNSSLKVNGIIHLFAISGSHIVLIISFFERIFKKIKFKNKVINIILFIYLLITKFSVSITRAVITYYCNQIFKMLKIKLTSLDISCFVFIVLIIINPFYMYNLGFVLSFASTFLIILMSTYLKDKGNIKSILIITIVINIFALPFTINLNNEFNILSPIINILMILIVEGIIIPLSFIVAVFPVLKIGYTYIILGFINLNQVITSISYKLGFVICIGVINEFYIFIYYLLILLLIIFVKKKIYFNFFITFLVCLLSIIIFNLKVIPNNQITFLDLYNGDATLIEYNHEKILIDTGEGINNEVSSFLKAKGIRKIDYLILTHNHSDHNGEASNIIEYFNVKNVVVNIYDNSVYSDYNNVIKLRKGDILKTKNIEFLCLSPNENSNNENNNSLVLYFEINNIFYLFTGDIEEEIEKQLPTIKVDVLKVSHHGSNTSTSISFLNKIKPQYSIIMSGRSNKYKFPSQIIIDRLNSINSKIYCTKDCYTIILEIKNKKLNFLTLKKPSTFN